MSERKQSTVKKNSNRVKIDRRPFCSSIQKSYYKPVPKEEDTTLKMF